MSDMNSKSFNSENLKDSGEKSENQEDEQSLLKLLITTTESHILALGIVIALLYIVGLALSLLWSPEKFHVLVAMTVTNIIFGRAAGMSVGYTMELSHSIVVLINMLIETILVLLFYPLFVFSWRRLLVIPALKNIMERTSKAAEAHHEKIRKYGIIGLFVFVWSPFWMTGPVVGCAIGFLLGFRPWFTLIVVLLGTYLAIVCWSFFLLGLHEHVASYSPFAPFVLLTIIILIVVVIKFLHGIRRENRSDKK